MAKKKLEISPNRKVIDFIMRILENIPESDKEASSDPGTVARALTAKAALQSAGLSGTLAIPPGPLGILTILPDLYGVWKIQAQLISDVARVYGREKRPEPSEVLYCMFRHVSSHVGAVLAVKAGSRVLSRRASLRVIQKVVALIAGKVTQRVIRSSLSRWLPIVGAVGVAGYAYYDTAQVGKNCMDLFGKLGKNPTGDSKG
jgi:uncharacterized protein (DUF697 family)